MLDFAVGFELASIEDIVSSTQKAEAEGFESCWIAEDYYFRGAISLAAAVAANTRRIRIGTGVINPYTRHPVLIAMEMQGLDELSGGRAFLGLGASERFWMEDQLHIEYDSPRRSLQESVQILRGVWEGEAFSYAGKRFRVSQVKLQFRPLRPQLPIYLGVMREHNLALAGEIADGVMLPLFSSPPYVRFAMEHVRRGAEQAGRNLKDFRVYTYALLSVDDDRAVARERVKTILGRWLGYLRNHPAYTCTGRSDAEIQPFAEALAKGKDCTHLVADWMIDTFAIAGSPEECREKLRALEETGVTGIVAFELLTIPMKETISSVARHIFPFFQQ